MKLCDIALAFILGCVIAFLVYLAWNSYAFGYSDDEEVLAPECQTEIYQLFIGGILVRGFPDMDALECDLAAGEIEAQTPPFTKIECKQRYVCRQKL